MRSVPGAVATWSNRFSSIGGWDLTQQTRLLYKLPRFMTNAEDNT